MMPAEETQKQTQTLRGREYSVTEGLTEGSPPGRLDALCKARKMIGLVAIAMCPQTELQKTTMDEFIENPRLTWAHFLELMTTLFPNSGRKDSFNDIQLNGEKGYHLGYEDMAKVARLQNVLLAACEKLFSRCGAVSDENTYQIHNLLVLVFVLLSKTCHCYETLKSIDYFKLLENTWDVVGLHHRGLIESHIDRMLSTESGGFLCGTEITIGKERGYALVQATECALRLLCKNKSIKIDANVELLIRKVSYKHVFGKDEGSTTYNSWLTDISWQNGSNGRSFINARKTLVKKLLIGGKAQSSSGDMAKQFQQIKSEESAGIVTWFNQLASSNFIAIARTNLLPLTAVGCAVTSLKCLSSATTVDSAAAEEQLGGERVQGEGEGVDAARQDIRTLCGEVLAQLNDKNFNEQYSQLYALFKDGYREPELTAPPEPAKLRESAEAQEKEKEQGWLAFLALHVGGAVGIKTGCCMVLGFLAGMLPSTALASVAAVGTAAALFRKENSDQSGDYEIQNNGNQAPLM